MPYPCQRNVSQHALLPIVLMLIGIGGCDEANKRTFKMVADDYNAGHFREALIGANALADQSTGIQSDQARYFAGLSAYRLGRDDEAMKYLQPLAGHADVKLAGPANATLGLIAASRDDDPRALRYLTTAAEKLTGAEAGRAHYHMAISQQKMGLWSTAKAHLDLALQSTTDADLRKVIRQRMAAQAFTIQLGAYGQKKNADDRALEMRQAASSAGLGSTNVVPTISDGKRLFLVQAGRFTVYAEAKRARDRLSTRDAWIVTTDAGR